MSSVIRYTVRWPHVRENSGGTFASAPLPSIPENGSEVILNSVGSISTTQPDTYLGAPSDPNRVMQRLQIAKVNGGEPLTAITIAPDSAIFCCNIHANSIPSDRTTHRVTPGNPFIVGADIDQLSVSIPTSVHAIDARPDQDTFVWDAIPVNIGPGGIVFWGVPLRLECWYGMLPIRSDNRAPLHVRVILKLAAGVARGMIVPVDGRKRISMTVQTSTTTLTYTTGETEPASNAVTPTSDSGSPPRVISTAAIPSIGTTRVDILDNKTPITYLLLSFVDSAGTGAGQHQVDVWAWDAT